MQDFKLSPFFFMIPLLVTAGCNSDAVRALKQQCTEISANPNEAKACKTGVDYGFSNWRWGLDPAQIDKTEVDSAVQEALSKCHDKHPGGVSAMPLRSSCERGVRLVREYALGYLKLFEGKPPRVGSKNNGGGKDSISDSPGKGYVPDQDRFNSIRGHFQSGSDNASESDEAK